MFHKNFVFVLIYCIIFLCSFIVGEYDKSKEDNEDISDFDRHTFVALIDIVFVDGTKRTCTGAIIHDNVVITAAHCFVHESEYRIKPELTASFVVIGSKKMFDTGYEQYLPIERIVTHPHFRGWTADLSLVYTFAGMTSDKPGKIIPLAGERMSNPVDSNVTVFSWGHCKDQDFLHTKHVTPKRTPSPDSSSNEYEDVKVTVGLKEKYARRQKPRPQSERPQNQYEQQLVENIQPPDVYLSASSLRQQHRFQTEDRNQARKHLFYKYPKLGLRNREDDYQTVKRRITTVKHSRYLTSNEEDEDMEWNDRNSSSNNSSLFKNTQMDSDEEIQGSFVEKSAPESINRFKSIYKNWRRSMGSQQNKLTVELFGFVNLATCKKIVEGATPPRYEVKNGEVACYSSEEHYLTDEDSGAPAVRHGHLVAVTVGGAQADGDQVGVGMKMSCYCNWIADNLPEGGHDLNCCKNCCDVNTHSDETPAKKVLRHKKKV